MSTSEHKWLALAEYLVPLLLVAFTLVLLTPHPLGALINIAAYGVYLGVLFWGSRLVKTGRGAAAFVVLLPLLVVVLEWWGARSVGLSSKVGDHWAFVDGNPTLLGASRTYLVFLVVGFVWLGAALVARSIAARTSRQGGA